MQSALRVVACPARVSRQIPAISYSVQPKRFAHQSYGNEQSGMQQGTNEKNPKSHLEHPGPEAPSTSKGGKPAIHRPKSAAEKDDPEVRKHNEELEQRHERTTNQLSEKDNKVDKNFWKGDVGPKGSNKES